MVNLAGSSPLKPWITICKPNKSSYPEASWNRSPAGRLFSTPTAIKPATSWLMNFSIWWNERKEHLTDVKRLVINVDNGPECNGHRSQFLATYSRICRHDPAYSQDMLLPTPTTANTMRSSVSWAGLEKSWNGYLLDTVKSILQRSANFVWKGFGATVRLLNSVYERGVKLCKKDKVKLEQRLQRSPELPSYDITIDPKMVFQ